MNKPSKEQQEILRRIGEMPNENKRVFLHKPFFKALSDNEFKVFWNLPFNVQVTPRTKKYIETRSKALGLKVDESNGFDLQKN